MNNRLPSLLAIVTAAFSAPGLSVAQASEITAISIMPTALVRFQLNSTSTFYFLEEATSGEYYMPNLVLLNQAYANSIPVTVSEVYDCDSMMGVDWCFVKRLAY